MNLPLFLPLDKWNQSGLQRHVTEFSTAEEEHDATAVVPQTATLS